MQTGPCDFIHVFWDSIRMILLTTFVLTQALFFPVSAHIQAVSVPDEIQDKLNVILRKEFIVHVRGRFFFKGTTTSEWWELSLFSQLFSEKGFSLALLHWRAWEVIWLMGQNWIEISCCMMTGDASKGRGTHCVVLGFSSTLLWFVLHPCRDSAPDSSWEKLDT